MTTDEPTTLSTRVEPAGNPTPMVLIQMAMAHNADVDKLTKLFELQERWVASEIEREKREAKMAYIAAIGAFKKNPPVILKSTQVKFETQKGITEYMHATLDQVSRVIGDALSAVGIIHTWNITQPNGSVSVTCTLTHERGHAESVTMSAASDNSGGKNSIQAISSSTTYLQRYTLLAITGMATKGMDNDGRGDPNQNPEPNKDAPTTKTREERKKEPPAQKPPAGPPSSEEVPPEVTKNELIELSTRWVQDCGTGDKEKDKPAYASWARQLIGDNFDATKTGAHWTRARLNTLRKYIGLPQDGDL